ncbi:MAG: HlyC/CorC family transporter [Candidatus Methanomethylophilus sp.]|nr:HlyC/CorC family transporter [Methanomethylophilus sp.]
MDTLVLIILVAAVAVLLILSGFFSASETSYTGLNRTRLKSMDPDGTDKRVQRTLQNYEQFDRLLTTILVGNNMVNIASSTICTLIMVSYLGDTWGTVAATVLMITLLLIIGEISPKTMAKRNPEKMAIRLSGAIAFSMKLLKYITSVFMKVTKSVNYVAGAEEESPTITEDELSLMIDEIQQEGTLEKNESELIKSALEFDDTKVGEICTPRVDIVSVSITADIESLKSLFISTEFSRIPVYEGSVDRIIGTIFFKDFFMKYSSKKKFRVTDLIRPVKFVPKDAGLDSVMNELQKSKLHMAIVLDEFGGTFGIVTMEDILEELVGEIWDESDDVKRAFVRESETQYMVLGDADIFEVMTDLGLNFDPEEYKSGTVGGYLAYKLEKVPNVGDSVDAGDVLITVRSVRSRRVRETTFTIKPRPPEFED